MGRTFGGVFVFRTCVCAQKRMCVLCVRVYCTSEMNNKWRLRTPFKVKVNLRRADGSARTFLELKGPHGSENNLTC